MWIAKKPFRYRGVSYKAGDQVPAEKWPGRKALVSMRKLAQVFDTGTPEQTAVEPPQVDPAKLKRAELNAYATEQGVEDAEGYSSRESLLEKLNSLDVPEETDADAASSLIETEVQLPESNEEDSLWSDNESDAIQPETTAESVDTGK